MWTTQRAQIATPRAPRTARPRKASSHSTVLPLERRSRAQRCFDSSSIRMLSIRRVVGRNQVQQLLAAHGGAYRGLLSQHMGCEDRRTSYGSRWAAGVRLNVLH